MRLALAFCLCAGSVWAQDEATTQPTEPIAETAEANGGVLRGLDKVSGATVDIEMLVGASKDFGRLQVTMSDCRYPADDPSSNSYAHLTIREGAAAVVFDGWMVASSPALNALDHARYDIWLLRCNTSAASGSN